MKLLLKPHTYLTIYLPYSSPIFHPFFHQDGVHLVTLPLSLSLISFHISNLSFGL